MLERPDELSGVFLGALSTSLPGDGLAATYSATYEYDAHGSMTLMPHLPSIGWDHNDQMRQVGLGGGGTAYYTYDAAGQRVRKVWEHSGLVEERIYLGGWEVYRKRDSLGNLLMERETLHGMDGARRVVLVETKTVDVDAGGASTVVSRYRFQLDNHLGSASLEVDEAGLVIGYEEYHPYGTTAYASGRSVVEVSGKRYRYTGKERDEETALYYHGARHYAAWLARWTSADQAGLVDGTNIYRYSRDNPVVFVDKTGNDSTLVGGAKALHDATAALRGPDPAPAPVAIPLMTAIDRSLGTVGGKPPPPPAPPLSELLREYATPIPLSPEPKSEPEPQPEPQLKEDSEEGKEWFKGHHALQTLALDTAAHSDLDLKDISHGQSWMDMHPDYSFVRNERLTKQFAITATEALVVEGVAALGAADGVIATVDAMAETGYLGGKLYGPRRLATLERHLDNRGVDLLVGDEFLGLDKAGGFRTFSPDAGLRPQLILGSNPTEYQVTHELGHYVHYSKVGPEAYWNLPRTRSWNVPEQAVFDMLEHPARWSKLNPAEQAHAIGYVERVGIR